MALSKTYYSINGQIRGEHRSGEANSRDYMHDNLGNVVAVFQNDWEIAEASYKPYGEMISNWNFGSHGYRFAWNGGNGYRKTNMAYVTHYVRARHYSEVMGTWTTRDPLWPQEMPYNYVEGRVMSAVDYSGMVPKLPLLGKRGIPPKTPCDSTNNGAKLRQVIGRSFKGNPEVSSCGTLVGSVDITGQFHKSGGLQLTLGFAIECDCKRYTYKLDYRYEEYQCFAPKSKIQAMAMCTYPPIHLYVEVPEKGNWVKTGGGKCKDGELIVQYLECPGFDDPILYKTTYRGCPGSSFSTWGPFGGSFGKPNE
ncbi:MAG: hypothetical protein KF824_06885 [Fimbriimonadaceae bacterium]|nr:MAG: hypothetical protein KF824_06885 [Fimbriimonadaceae bacterium]